MFLPSRVRRGVLGAAGVCALLAFSASACSDDADAPEPQGFAGAGGSGGDSGSSAACPTEFRYQPPAGQTVTSVALAGEWNGFDGAALMDGPDASGVFSARVDLTPGMHGYKLVLNGSDWVLDPAQGYRKYLDGTENSAVRVLDCAVPHFEVEAKSNQPNTSGGGHFSATLKFVPAVNGAALDAGSLRAEILHPVPGQLDKSQLSVDTQSGAINLDYSLPTDAKVTLVVSASDQNGVASRPLRLPFWLEARPFEWNDALIYMIVTDRYKDGDPSNNPAATSGVQDSRADWQGGDLIGVRQKVEDGTLSQLGVRALWLTPFQTNPAGSYLASDNFHQVTGYHGYWPIKAREVDPRIGGEQALRDLVGAAHAKGIRVLMDYVVNHVHAEHEYFAAHPDWFRTGCVCGTSGCDWTAQRLDCLFADYLPDVNWTVPAAAQQFADDAVWWIDTFDLDGLRVDAVKHVEDAAVTNLATRVREEFEAAGDRYFLMGETAMGWSDCGVDCNREQYDTISRYIGKFALDGQFDFVLYHAVPYRVFAYDDQGMLHADYWAEQSQLQYPAGSVMTPFIGSHDSQRFTTLSSYRGQPGYDRGVPGNQWDNVAGPPPDAEAYQRQALALAWLFGLPGAPLLYYGDEYGEWGGADPGNRALWRGDSATLSGDEQGVLDRTRKLGALRQEITALRRGSYRSLHATETFLAFARLTDANEVAIVALSKDPGATSTSFDLPATLPIANDASLAERLAGGTVQLSGRNLSVSLPGRGAAILTPN